MVSPIISAGKKLQLKIDAYASNWVNDRIKGKLLKKISRIDDIVERKSAKYYGPMISWYKEKITKNGKEYSGAQTHKYMVRSLCKEWQKIEELWNIVYSLKCFAKKVNTLCSVHKKNWGKQHVD